MTEQEALSNEEIQDIINKGGEFVVPGIVYDLANELMKHRASLPPPADQEARELWRELLWVRHGCRLAMLYGDDGEMQCSQCGIDFKRWTPEQIQSRWQQIAGTRSTLPKKG